MSLRVILELIVTDAMLPPRSPVRLLSCEQAEIVERVEETQPANGTALLASTVVLVAAALLPAAASARPTP